MTELSTDTKSKLLDFVVNQTVTKDSLKLIEELIKGGTDPVNQGLDKLLLGTTTEGECHV